MSLYTLCRRKKVSMAAGENEAGLYAAQLVQPWKERVCKKKGYRNPKGMQKKGKTRGS
jgi:hypothetical protein